MIEQRWVWPGEADAVFDCRPGSTDELVIREVWAEAVYVRHPGELRDRRVLDLGANIGAFSILAAKAGARSVVVVEPEHGNLAALSTNLRLNGLERSVLVLAGAAVGLDWQRYVVGTGGPAYTSSAPVTGARPVQAFPVAALVEQLGPFDLVKIDVEGDEWSILPALISTGMDGVGSIIAEIHGPGMCEHLVTVPDVGSVLAGLAEFGSVDVVGRPSVGGTLRWTSYTPPSREEA